MAKCHRCSLPIEARDLIIELGDGDVIHIRCWLVAETDERVRESHEQIQRAKKRIDDARRMMRGLPDADPTPESDTASP